MLHVNPLCMKYLHVDFVHVAQIHPLFFVNLFHHKLDVLKVYFEEYHQDMPHLNNLH